MIIFRLGSVIPMTTMFGNVGASMTTESVQFASALNWEGVFYENIGTSDRQTVGSNITLGFATNKTHLLCIAGDPAHGTQMYMNGTQVATWTYGDAYTNYLWSIGRTHGMGYDVNNFYFQGIIGEIRIYDHRLSNDDLSTTHAEMKTKWGIA